MGEAVQ